MDMHRVVALERQYSGQIVGATGQCRRYFPDLYRRAKAGGRCPIIVTDQTSAHDPINGHLPQGWSIGEWNDKRKTDPKAVEKAARASMALQVEAMCRFHAMGVVTVEYGANIRQMALEEGLKMRLIFVVLCPPIFDLCSAVASARFAGRHCPVIARISTKSVPR